MPLDTELVRNLSLMIPGVATLVNTDLVLKGRIPRSALGEYSGIANLLK